MDNRGVTPVVEKTLAIGLVTLFVSLVSVALYGGAVPEYRTATADELAERTLAKASERVQQAVPPNATRAQSRVRVSLPATIRGVDYRIRPEGDTLVLVHPAEGVGARARLALPGSVTRVEGVWESEGPNHVVVERRGSRTVVRLQTGGE
ncbi:MAG: hypothetical protein ABEJ30_06150 [Halorientalis sp.]